VASESVIVFAMSQTEENKDEAKTGLMGKISGYGATITGKKETPRDGPEEKEPKPWEARGTIFGLCVDLGMIIWIQSVPLATMFIHSMVSYGKMFPCEEGGTYGLSFQSACFCAYSKAFIRGFAPLALTAMCLIIGRDLLQKRTYYSVLKHRGVLEFAANNPFKDPVFLAVLVSYIHLILHLIFIIWATGFFSSSKSSKFMQYEGEDITGGDVKNALGDAFAFRLIVELVSFIVLPATLFIIFFFTAYDIEATLVPLSQYVHDARDAGEGAELSQLEIMEDCWVKEVLDGKAPDILGDAEDHENEFRQLLDEYNQQRKTLEAKELVRITMTESLWPAQLLLPSEASQDKPAKAFRVLWTVYFVAACIFGFLVLWLLVHYCLRDLIKVLDSHIPCTISLGVEICFLVGCTLILAKIIGAHRTGRALAVKKKADPEAEKEAGKEA
jgi:hypothetical protein